METLPEDMVEEIAVHLTLQDLSACCLVSRGWREAFNKDIIWRHHSFCDPARDEHLRETVTVVEPHIQLPEGTETISPLCEKRESLVLEKHLWSNWREGRFKKTIILNRSFVADRISFLTNAHLVLLSKSKITVWNVYVDSDDGFFKPVELPSDRRVGLCKMAGNDKVIVVQECMVYVFLWDLDSIQWCFQYAFSLTESNNTLVRKLEAVEFPIEQIQFCSSNVFGNILFGWLEGQRVIHIWDIEKCKKLIEQELPTSNHIYIKDFKQSETQKENILIATIQSEGRDQCPMIVCYVYDLMKFAFLPFQGAVRYDNPNIRNPVTTTALFDSLCNTGAYFIHGKNVSVSIKCQSQLYIFNFRTGHLNPVAISNVYGIPLVFNDNLFYYSSKSLIAYDPLNKTFTTVIGDLPNPRTLLNIGNKFCITYHKKANSLYCDGWEIGKNLEATEAKTKLFYWNPGVVLSNEAGTVLLTISKSEGRLCKLCFW